MSGKEFLFVGNDRCLDFVNTRPVRDGARVELLEGLSDLVAWLVETARLDPSEAEAFLRRWEGTTEGAVAMDQALAFRAEMETVADNLAHRGTVPALAIVSVNRWLRKPRRYSQIIGTVEGPRSRDGWLLEAASDVLAPLAEFARELLCEKAPELVRRCGNPDCVLYFHDTSKNHARRWCSMEACGNRVKVARFRARKRSS